MQLARRVDQLFEGWILSRVLDLLLRSFLAIGLAQEVVTLVLRGPEEPSFLLFSLVWALPYLLSLVAVGSTLWRIQPWMVVRAVDSRRSLRDRLTTAIDLRGRAGAVFEALAREADRVLASLAARGTFGRPRSCPSAALVVFVFLSLAATPSISDSPARGPAPSGSGFSSQAGWRPLLSRHPGQGLGQPPPAVGTEPSVPPGAAGGSDREPDPTTPDALAMLGSETPYEFQDDVELLRQPIVPDRREGETHLKEVLVWDVESDPRPAGQASPRPPESIDRFRAEARALLRKARLREWDREILRRYFGLPDER